MVFCQFGGIILTVSLPHRETGNNRIGEQSIQRPIELYPSSQYISILATVQRWLNISPNRLFFKGRLLKTSVTFDVL